MASARYDVPDFLHEHVHDARKLSGLSGPEWDFGLAMDDRPGGSDRHGGAVVIHGPYLQARIEFSRDLEDDEEGRETAFHEVWHVGLDELTKIAREATKHIPNEPLREHFQKLLLEAEERYITRTVRSLLNLLNEEPEETVEEVKAKETSDG